MYTLKTQTDADLNRAVKTPTFFNGKLFKPIGIGKTADFFYQFCIKNYNIKNTLDDINDANMENTIVNFDFINKLIIFETQTTIGLFYMCLSLFLKNLFSHLFSFLFKNDIDNNLSNFIIPINTWKYTIKDYIVTLDYECKLNYYEKHADNIETNSYLRYNISFNLFENTYIVNNFEININLNELVDEEYMEKIKENKIKNDNNIKYGLTGALGASATIAIPLLAALLGGKTNKKHYSKQNNNKTRRLKRIRREKRIKRDKNKKYRI